AQGQDSEDAQREARRQAMGRQLDAEADQRAAAEAARALAAGPASSPSAPPGAASGAAPAAANDFEAQREARRQAMGRQLDAEADRRESAVSSLRRARLLGRYDPNQELVQYAEAWAKRIEMHMAMDPVREAARQRQADPVVTVAIRSNGTVESVTLVRSSGVAALDEAIPRLVHSLANYQAFPPGLASQYDVIEIRRSWHFDVAVRLY